MAFSVPNIANNQETRAGKAQASWNENLATVAFGLWLMAGVFIDGFAHANLRNTIENFFTPWHAILYSGFSATALWVVWMVFRRLRQGWTGLNAIPVGYELGLIGATVFGLGGVGDMIWHTVFGIEVGIDALLSPTHLMLYLGATLLITSPLRAIWHNSSATPSFKAFLPALLAVFASFSFTSFMNMHLWGLVNLPDSSEKFSQLANYGGNIAYLASRLSDAGILFSSAVIMFTALFLLRRWRTPVGTFTLILGLNTLAMFAMFGYGNYLPNVLLAALAGIIMDAMVFTMKPSPTKILELRVFAIIAPIVIWGLHFLALALTGGVGISRELWTGITVMTSLCGVALSVLVVPPAIANQVSAE
jgi:hypothetical protein